MAYLKPEQARNDTVGRNFSSAGVPSAGTSEVQTVAVTGTPTGGTFKLSFKGAGTTAIAYNAAAATVQAALEALPTIGTGNVVCGGGPLPTGVTVTFQGTLARRAVPTLVLFAPAFVGGTTPTVTITKTTPGVDSVLPGRIPKGALVTDKTNGKVYINTGTSDVPTWTVVGAQT